LHLALDRPNERSLHAAPRPRIGGLGIAVGVLLGFVLVPALPTYVVPCYLGLASISFLDDRLGVAVTLRLSAHFAAAGVWVVAAMAGQGLAMTLLLVFCIVWATNLYNFMDGSDGLAGGMTVIGFSFLAVAAWQTGHPDLAALCASVAGAGLGFLAYNFPPARLFMGDVGSVPLGFLAGAIGCWGSYEGAWPPWLPALVFAPFLADASVTLARRMFRGERVWHAHRDHYYQRLIRMGWSHRRTALVEYAIMFGLGLLGVRLCSASEFDRLIGLAFASLLLASLMALVDRKWVRFQRIGS
jgi:UDP-N-acetylmuramyl pentapeptide phosphotransferase/UDP-N-acetylglucosamine-1-phosphate transferase